VAKLPISITCDCGEAASVSYGDRWTCPRCGRTWDTTQIPRAEYDRIVRGVRLYGLLTIGPPLLAAAILIPLTLFIGLQFALLFFLFVLAWALLVVPQLRRRANRIVREQVPKWKLRPE
jgi:hypothetical protein